MVLGCPKYYLGRDGLRPVLAYVVIQMNDLSLTVEQNQRLYEGMPAAEYQCDLVSKVVIKMSAHFLKWRSCYNRFLDVGAGNGGGE